MLFISNTGKSKTLRVSSGMLVSIPGGTSSQINDPAFEVAVKNNTDLKFISKGEFDKSKIKTPVKKPVVPEEKKVQEPEKKKQETQSKKTPAKPKKEEQSKE